MHFSTIIEINVYIIFCFYFLLVCEARTIKKMSSYFILVQIWVLCYDELQQRNFKQSNWNLFTANWIFFSILLILNYYTPEIVVLYFMMDNIRSFVNQLCSSRTSYKRAIELSSTLKNKKQFQFIMKTHGLL